jgi:hypothetical protein
MGCQKEVVVTSEICAQALVENMPNIQDEFEL